MTTAAGWQDTYDELVDRFNRLVNSSAPASSALSEMTEFARDVLKAAAPPPPSAAAERAGEALDLPEFLQPIDEAREGKSFDIWWRGFDPANLLGELKNAARTAWRARASLAPRAPAPAQGKCPVCKCTRTHCAVCCENGNLSRPAQGYAEGLQAAARAVDKLRVCEWNSSVAVPGEMYFREALKAIRALSPAPEEGYVRVPSRMTEAMISAGADHWPHGGKIVPAMQRFYMAVIAAAEGKQT